MDFELLEECSLDVSLHLVCFSEFTIHINSLEVVDDADFFSIINFLIVFKQLGDDFFIRAWLSDFPKSTNTLLMVRQIGIIVCEIKLRFQNFLKNCQLLLLKIFSVMLFLSCVQFDCWFDRGHNIVLIPQENKWELIFEKQEAVHIKVELFMFSLNAAFQASE